MNESMPPSGPRRPTATARAMTTSWALAPVRTATRTTAMRAAACTRAMAPVRAPWTAPEAVRARVSRSSAAASEARRRSCAPSWSTSAVPWMSSPTCAATSPRPAATVPADRQTVPAETSGISSTTSAKGMRMRASPASTAVPSHVSAIDGAMTAETAGGKVWAKNTSMRSMSRVAVPTRAAPARPRVAAGACGMRAVTKSSRSRWSAVKATQCPA